MTPTAHTPDRAPTEPLLRPLLRVLARTAPAARRRLRPQPSERTPDRRLPLQCGDSFRWPDGTWTHSG
ncbi:MAG: hypothetical protein L0H84_20520 [Pseudonocardia sp.]|nr:hypothetical protein [Pseudonocardia sp.]